MRKDIHIPEVKNVFIAAVKEYPQDSDNYEWVVYILNNQLKDLELVIVVSQGFSKQDKSSTLRKTIQMLPQKSFAKLEILPEELFKLTNTYKLSFFSDNKLFDKTYTFDKNVIKDSSLETIPLLSLKGILAK